LKKQLPPQKQTIKTENPHKNYGKRRTKEQNLGNVGEKKSKTKDASTM